MKKIFLSDFLNIILLFAFFTLIFTQKTIAQQDSPPTVVTLKNGYRITFLGVSNDFERKRSTWRYRVEELPSAQDLSNWMLELFDCHKVIKATPSSWLLEDPDPNIRLSGIKWEEAGVQDSAKFSVTLKGHWKVGTNRVGAKGPDVARGLLAGPSCRIFTPNIPIITAISPLLLQDSQITGALHINEFIAANAGTPGDPDWIEIYNSGNTEVNLQNLYLTDNLSDPTKYQITTKFTIPAGGFVVFYADNNPEQGPDHTNFSLNASGGDIALFKADGITVVDSYTYGTQTTGHSEGRCPDGHTTWKFFTAPTPGATNGMCK